MAPGPSALTRLQHRLQPLLRRAVECLLKPRFLLRVRLVGHERQVEVESAGADELTERLEARLDHVALPAGDLCAVLTASLGELALRESGPEARLTDERPARHEEILARRARKHVP